MSKWVAVTLGEVMKTRIDAVPTASLTSVNLAGVHGFGRGLFKRGQTSVAGATYKNFHRLRAGDFVISSPKAWEGAIARITDDFDGWFLSPVFPTFRADDSRLDTRYLGWYCKREAIWRQLQGKSRGMGARRETVSPEQFLSLEIPLPTISEQHALVARLDALADKSQQLTFHLDAIEATASAMVLSLHNRFSGGRVVSLSDLIELHEDTEVVHAEGSYSQVGLRSFGGGLFAKPAIAGTATTYRAFNRLYENAIVLSQVKGWEGAIALTPPEFIGMTASPEYRTFRCLPGKASPQYLVEVFRSPWFWSLLQDATRGVGARRERTRPEQFLNVTLPMPEYARQLDAIEAFERIAALKIRHNAIREANAALLPATLEQLFTA